MKKKKISLTSLIFMALCCDMGIIAKKLISPAANIITEYLHIPGGVGTSFALMFIVIGAVACNFFGSGLLMCFVQSIISFIIGTSGSMGMFVFIAYLVPGLIIDLTLLVLRHFSLERNIVGIAFTNAFAGLSAAFCANTLTFRLIGPPLWLYLGVAFTTGIIFGALASLLLGRLTPLLSKLDEKEHHGANNTKQ